MNRYNIRFHNFEWSIHADLEIRVYTLLYLYFQPRIRIVTYFIPFSKDRYSVCFQSRFICLRQNILSFASNKNFSMTHASTSRDTINNARIAFIQPKNLYLRIFCKKASTRLSSFIQKYKPFLRKQGEKTASAADTYITYIARQKRDRTLKKPALCIHTGETREPNERATQLAAVSYYMYIPVEV